MARGQSVVSLAGLEGIVQCVIMDLACLLPSSVGSTRGNVKQLNVIRGFAAQEG